MSFLFDVSRSTDSRQSMRSFVNHSGDWSFVICYNFEIKGEKKRIFYFVACVLCIYLYGGWGKNLSTV